MVNGMDIKNEVDVRAGRKYDIHAIVSYWH